MGKPRVCLLTFADNNYRRHQEIITRTAQDSGQFDFVFACNPEHLDERFVSQNHHILKQERGGGYWLWKPYLIHQTLVSLHPGDILLYMDCGDLLAQTEGLRNKLIELMEYRSIYLTSGAFKHSDYTKRDCFIEMGCDNESYHNLIQLEAGMSVWRADHKAILFAYQWLYFSKMDHVITDRPNRMGQPNLPGFIDHRHDQSILTNLASQQGIDEGGELRAFIHGNKNVI